MALSIIIWTMILTGLVGGIVNYLMPSNKVEGAPGTKKQGWGESIGLGIGATLLVPLFLEIAQSKLLDRIHPGYELVYTGATVVENFNGSSESGVETDSAAVSTDPIDSAATGDVGSPPERPTLVRGDENDLDQPAPLKNYLLYAAYCFLAATAGYRFIANISNSVLKEKELEEAKSDLAAKEEEKKQLELINTAVARELELKKQQGVLQMQQEERRAQTRVISESGSNSTIPVLPPITNMDDPQKGRFGGLSSRNNRALKAKVAPSNLPDFYAVTIWVESEDPINSPLTDEVFFYLHDSFSPSLYSVTPNKFRNGKAMDDEILSYGAFTVGAITDNGATMLELDLALQPEFPKQFRES
ncbi:MAG: YEATS-associated helix-containing protein [Cyclobacteriaceae bacterium]